MMRLLVSLVLLLFICTTSGWAQFIQATNENASRQLRYGLNQGVECEISVGHRPVLVRGKLVLIDSMSFRLQLGDGYYTTVLLNQLIRLRSRRYVRQRLAAAGTVSSLLGGTTLSSPSLATMPLVAVSALTGLGIALAGERASFRRKDPSTYQGWIFNAYP